MKLRIAFVVLIVMTLAIPVFAGQGGNGNGAPSGAHYNLNILGVQNPKNADMTNSDRHTIFVAMNKSGASVSTRINLTEGPFAVLDGNGTDGVAAFQLPVSNIDCAIDAPANDPCQNSGDYAVYIRALGKPGGMADITTCTEDKTTGELICSTEYVHVERTQGKQRFTNVTKELTSLCLDTTVPADGICDVRAQLFSDNNKYYYWDFDNQGLKLAQLRFYDVP